MPTVQASSDSPTACARYHPRSVGTYLAVGFDGAVYVLLGVDSGRVVFPAALEHSALQQSGVQPGQHGAAASQVVAVVGHRAVGKAESGFSSSNQMAT